MSTVGNNENKKNPHITTNKKTKLFSFEIIFLGKKNHIKHKCDTLQFWS